MCVEVVDPAQKAPNHKRLHRGNWGELQPQFLKKRKQKTKEFIDKTFYVTMDTCMTLTFHVLVAFCLSSAVWSLRMGFISSDLFTASLT